MLRKMIKNKKAQNTAEYAALIGMVIAAAIAISMYVQRGLGANVHKGIQYMDAKTVAADTAFTSQTQYEPYYLTKNYDVRTDSDTTQVLQGNNKSTELINSVTTRLTGGFTEQSYCESRDINK